jgi:hypothetical protein
LSDQESAWRLVGQLIVEAVGALGQTWERGSRVEVERFKRETGRLKGVVVRHDNAVGDDIHIGVGNLVDEAMTTRESSVSPTLDLSSERRRFNLAADTVVAATEAITRAENFMLLITSEIALRLLRDQICESNDV